MGSHRSQLRNCRFCLIITFKNFHKLLNIGNQASPLIDWTSFRSDDWLIDWLSDCYFVDRNDRKKLTWRTFTRRLHLPCFLQTFGDRWISVVHSATNSRTASSCSHVIRGKRLILRWSRSRRCCVVFTMFVNRWLIHAWSSVNNVADGFQDTESTSPLIKKDIIRPL